MDDCRGVLLHRRDSVGGGFMVHSLPARDVRYANGLVHVRGERIPDPDFRSRRIVHGGFAFRQSIRRAARPGRCADVFHELRDVAPLSLLPRTDSLGGVSCDSANVHQRAALTARRRGGNGFRWAKGCRLCIGIGGCLPVSRRRTVRRLNHRLDHAELRNNSRHDEHFSCRMASMDFCVDGIYDSRRGADVGVVECEAGKSCHRGAEARR